MTIPPLYARNWSGSGARYLEAVAVALHRATSDLHANTDAHGACSYCWRRAARALHELDRIGVFAATRAGAEQRDGAGTTNDLEAR